MPFRASAPRNLIGISTHFSVSSLARRILHGGSVRLDRFRPSRGRTDADSAEDTESTGRIEEAERRWALKMINRRLEVQCVRQHIKKTKKKRSVRCSRSSAIGGGEGKSGGVPLGSREGLNSFFAMEGERRRVDLHSGREGGG